MEDWQDDYDLDPENEIPIDPEQLEVEWFRQAGLYMKYGKAAGEAEKEAKEAHERVKLIRSELTADAHTNPSLCGGKATAPAVEAYYRNHKRHIKAKQEQIDAEYAFSVLAAAKSAVYMRKTSLENLVKLAAMGWFASPITPRTLTELQKRIESPDDKTVERKIASRRKTGKGMARRKKA